jgi:hypothetical protein
LLASSRFQPFALASSNSLPSTRQVPGPSCSSQSSHASLVHLTSPIAQPSRRSGSRLRTTIPEVRALISGLDGSPLSVSGTRTAKLCGQILRDSLRIGWTRFPALFSTAWCATKFLPVIYRHAPRQHRLSSRTSQSIHPSSMIRSWSQAAWASSSSTSVTP